MKKVIFLVFVVVSLNGSEFMCESYKESYFKYSKLTQYAIDRGGIRDVKLNATMALKYIEKVDAECVDLNQTSVKNIRKYLKDVLEIVNED